MLGEDFVLMRLKRAFPEGKALDTITLILIYSDNGSYLNAG